MNSKQTEEMDRVIKFLALELPEPVWNDVNKKWQGFKSGYAAAPQKGMGADDWGNGWDSAITLANNLCMQVSDEYNNDDEIEQATAANSCALRVRKYLGDRSYKPESFPPDESPSPSEAGDGWISVEQYLPGREDYYEVKFEDGTIDEKPFRIRYSKNILGFMTESKVAHWRPLLPRQNKLLNTIK